MGKTFNRLASLRAMPYAVFACLAVPAVAQNNESTLPAVVVEETRSIAEKNQLPATTESVTARQAADTINVMNTEDALKYLPSVLVRKRYIGDTQAPIATRTTGINAGARSLILADGILLSTLINNNNQNGSPQWFMVAPQEIERIDVMYGPFSAAYAGNSYGAVTEITTRMPQQFEAGVTLNAGTQNFSQYGTSDSYRSQQVSAILGNRSSALSWWFSITHLDSASQPVTYLSAPQSTTAASGDLPIVSGAYADRNRSGGRIQVVGAGNLTHTIQDNAKIKLAYDFSPAVSAAYTLGYWQNRADSNPQSYLSTAAGAPYFGDGSGSASVSIGGASYSARTIGALFSGSRVEQEHWMQSLSVKTKNQDPWDWEAAVSKFHYAKDITRTSTGAFPAAQNGGGGRIADAGGTGWTTLDLTGRWRPQGMASSHMLSFGVHADQYRLVNPTYNTNDWIDGDAIGSAAIDARGTTQTKALWLQDVWRLTPSIMATLGGRYETWRAYGGEANRPARDNAGFSPKASLTWQAKEQWQVTGSLGKAVRFPTVGELYQTVQTGATSTQANPLLKPESVLAGELAIERNTADGKLRISLFQEHVSDALIAQTSMLPGFTTPVSFVQNVDKTRQRGIELATQQKNFLIRGLELSGSLTYVDARILANSGYVATTPGTSSVGKRTPYVPDWRATLVATYRPDDQWAYTLAGRYSGRLFGTVDNTDINPATYQGFESFFVLDARVRYRLNRQWSAALGVDNISNRKYFLFHPFPQRSLFAELKYEY